MIEAILLRYSLLIKTEELYQSVKAPVDGIDVKNLTVGLYAVSLTRINGFINSY
jgi:hypothetical protein